MATTTDNGSNFAKAFREFGVKDFLVAMEDEEDCASCSSYSSCSDEENIDEGTEVNISDNDSNLLLPEQPELRLPRHIRCSAHTLNLCITTDMIRAIKNDTVLLLPFIRT